MNLDVLKKALELLDKIRGEESVIVANLTLAEPLKELIITRTNFSTFEYEHYLNNTQIYFTPYIAKNSFSIMTRLDYEKFKESTQKNDKLLLK